MKKQVFVSAATMLFPLIAFCEFQEPLRILSVTCSCKPIIYHSESGDSWEIGKKLVRVESWSDGSHKQIELESILNRRTWFGAEGACSENRVQYASCWTF